MSELTHDIACDLLMYCAETGELRWRKSPRYRIPAGAIAGNTNKRGYKQVRVLGKRYYAHRLIWLMTYGEWPAVIDHIDGDISNNKLSNLRSVSQQINLQNKHRATKRNRTGLLGVSIAKNKFSATIGVNGAHLYIGRFNTPEEAHSAYLEAKRQLHAVPAL